jgi:hypothetical protein
LEFLPRNAIKGQALANFLAKFTNLPETEDLIKTQTWVIYVGGSSMRKYGGAGVVIINPSTEELCSSLKLEFKTTNNEKNMKQS